MNRSCARGLPDVVTYGGFYYCLCDEPMEKGDWFIDHQKHYLGLDPVEDCDSESLAEFINNKENVWHGAWGSRKIKETNDPVINKSYL